MDNKKLKVRKLVLSRETILNLDADDLKQVVGGRPPVGTNGTNCDNPECWKYSLDSACC